MKSFRAWLGLAAIVGSFFAFAREAKAFSFVSEITGADMAGMKITATFKSGASETAIWGATGIDSGAASGTDWNLSVAGDTLFAFWNFTYTGENTISSLKIDALPGNTVLDKIFLPELTPGTGRGNLFGSSGFNPPTGIYSGTIDGVLEDINTSLEIMWSDGFTKEDAPVTFVFDTDKIEGYTPDPTPVPEPSATLGLVVGVGSCCFALRKRK